MEVTVYSTPTCPYCKKVKNYLEDKGVDFDAIDVSENQQKQQEMVEKSGQMGVPVTDIDGEIIVGYNTEKIDAALES